MTSFSRVFRSELRVVLSRFSAKTMLGLSLFLGITLPLLIIAIHTNAADANISIQTQGQSMDSGQTATYLQHFIGNNIAKCMGRVLYVRNFFLIPLLILLAAATSLAGERGSNELRESLCQPISRSRLLHAKTSALLTLCAISLLVTLLPSLVLGLSYYEQSGDIGNVLLAYLLSLFSDLALILLAFVCGLFSKSAAIATILTFLVLIGNFLLNGLLGFSKFFASPEISKICLELIDYLPWKAFSAWQYWEHGWLYAPIIGLIGIIAVLGAFLHWRFGRMDI